MNRLMLLAAVGAVVGLGACDRSTTQSETRTETDNGKALRTIAKLDCPQKEGELTLVSAAADGKSCNYTTDGADVRIGNIKVDADSDGGAKVQVGASTTVNANDGGAEIRTAKAAGGEVRSTYILASDSGASGYHVVGYEARGPKAGPIVVAVVKAQREERSQHDLFDDMKDLVERNVGG